MIVSDDFHILSAANVLVMTTDTAEAARRYVMARVEPDPFGGCWLWTGAMALDGYGSFRMGGGQLKAHRASWEAFNGPIPEGKLACHKCDVRACVNPEHLFLGTHQENTRDMHRKGRAANFNGERSSNAKLTLADVLELRTLRDAGMALSALASRYGVAESTVCRAARGSAWGAPQSLSAEV